MHQPNHLSKQCELAAYHCAAVVVRLIPANVLRERVDEVDVAALDIRSSNPGARCGRHLQRPVTKRTIQICTWWFKIGQSRHTHTHTHLAGLRDWGFAGDFGVLIDKDLELRSVSPGTRMAGLPR